MHIKFDKYKTKPGFLSPFNIYLSIFQFFIIFKNKIFIESNLIIKRTLIYFGNILFLYK